MEETTITVENNTGLCSGDNIGVTSFDMRWWKRLLYFLTFRGAPRKTEYYKIMNADEMNGTIITIK